MPWYLVFCLLCLPLAGCKKNPSPPALTEITGNAMTIDFKVMIGSDLNEKMKAEVLQTIVTTFEEVDRLYNKWNPSSEISYLNSLEGGKVVSISPEMEAFLNLAKSMTELSEGKFDVTIEPIQTLWKETLRQGKEPLDKELRQLALCLGWDKIHFGHGLFSKDYTLTQLDLGGIAKGHCVDLLVERLAKLGFLNVYAEWGGEVRAKGRHPHKRAWKVYVSNFEDTLPQHALAYMDLNDQALATSGDYLQNWKIIDKETGRVKTYFHIFDPSSLRPLESTPESIGMVSVLAPNCALADSLATAAMMFSITAEREAWQRRVLAKYPTVKFWQWSRNEKTERELKSN